MSGVWCVHATRRVRDFSMDAGDDLSGRNPCSGFGNAKQRTAASGWPAVARLTPPRGIWGGVAHPTSPLEPGSSRHFPEKGEGEEGSEGMQQISKPANPPNPKPPPEVRVNCCLTVSDTGLRASLQLLHQCNAVVRLQCGCSGCSGSCVDVADHSSAGPFLASTGQARHRPSKGRLRLALAGFARCPPAARAASAAHPVPELPTPRPPTPSPRLLAKPRQPAPVRTSTSQGLRPW